eukprot:g2331.t1
MERGNEDLDIGEDVRADEDEISELVVGLYDRVSELSEVAAQLKGECEQKNDRIRSVESEFSKLAKCYSGALSHIRSSDAARKKLRSETNRLRDRIHRLEDELAKTKKEMSGNIEEAEAIVTQQQIKCEKIAQEKSCAQARVAELETNNARLIEEAKRTDLMNKELKRASEEYSRSVRQYETDLQNATTRLRDDSELREKLEERVLTLSGELESTTAFIEEMRSENMAQLNRLKSIDEQHAKEVMALRKTNSDRVTALDIQVMEIMSKHDKLERACKVKEDAIREARSEIERIYSMYKEATARVELQEKEIEKLRGEVKSARADASMQATMVRSLETKVEQLQNFITRRGLGSLVNVASTPKRRFATREARSAPRVTSTKRSLTALFSPPQRSRVFAAGRDTKRTEEGDIFRKYRFSETPRPSPLV